MPRLQELVPEAETLLALEPEELGGILLQVMGTKETMHRQFHPGAYEGDLFNASATAYPRIHQAAVLRALREAFAWLEGQALIVPSGGGEGWRVLSRRGKRLSTSDAWSEYRKAGLLPKVLLHQRIADSVYFNFQRGDYQTAVFIAFREVEIAVREASRITDVLGTKLMRAAFNPSAGPLRDPKADPGEQVATMELFAGAIGSYKNPHSHRKVALDAEDAVEMLLLASHLLKVVDARKTLKEAPGS